MKKYFIKIVVGSLIAVIFPMTSNFCVLGFTNPVFKMATAEAAVNDSQFTNNDACLEAPVAGAMVTVTAPEPATGVIKSAPLAHHNNSLLPCCVGSNHPTAITSSQSVEIEKLAPAIVSIYQIQPKIIPVTIAYHTPNISPPELLAVQTTNLRI